MARYDHNQESTHDSLFMSVMIGLFWVLVILMLPFIIVWLLLSNPDNQKRANCLITRSQALRQCQELALSAAKEAFVDHLLVMTRLRHVYEVDAEALAGVVHGLSLAPGYEDRLRELALKRIQSDGLATGLDTDDIEHYLYVFIRFFDLLILRECLALADIHAARLTWIELEPDQEPTAGSLRIVPYWSDEPCGRDFILTVDSRDYHWQRSLAVRFDAVDFYRECRVDDALVVFLTMHEDNQVILFARIPEWNANVSAFVRRLTDQGISEEDFDAVIIFTNVHSSRTLLSYRKHQIVQRPQGKFARWLFDQPSDESDT